MMFLAIMQVVLGIAMITVGGSNVIVTGISVLIFINALVCFSIHLRNKAAERAYYERQAQREEEERQREAKRQEKERERQAEIRRKQEEHRWKQEEHEARLKAIPVQQRHAFEQRRLMTDSLRYDILRRDNFRCQICGATAADGVQLHVDHIFPVSKGGKTEPSNLRTLCDRCNRGKSDKIE